VRDLLDRCEVHVPCELAGVEAIDAHVDDPRAGLHHVARHHAGPSRRDAEDIGAPGVEREVAGAGMAHRHRGVPREEQLRQRLADEPRAADDDRFRAFEPGAVVIQHFEATGRRAGHDGGGARQELTEVGRSEAVDVFCRTDAAHDCVLVEALGQRQLHEDPVDARVGVELIDQLEQRPLAQSLGIDVVRRRDADRCRRVLLAAHVHRGRGICAHEDDREARRHASRRLQLGDALADPIEDLLRDRLAIEDHDAAIRRRSIAVARPVSGTTVMTTPCSAAGPFAVSKRIGIW
jgi:hypothetical protein